jgi:hypothetical protein
MTDLDAIRERDATYGPEVSIDYGAADRRALLAYIDGLAEAVERLPTQLGWDEADPDASHWVDRAAVLAILRGE